MQNLEAIFTPDVMIFMIVAGGLNNIVIIGAFVLVIWILAPKLTKFFESITLAVKDGIQLLQDFKHSIDELKDVVHEMSNSIDSLNSRMKRLETALDVKELAKK